MFFIDAGKILEFMGSIMVNSSTVQMVKLFNKVLVLMTLLSG